MNFSIKIFILFFLPGIAFSQSKKTAKPSSTRSGTIVVADPALVTLQEGEGEYVVGPFRYKIYDKFDEKSFYGLTLIGKTPKDSGESASAIKQEINESAPSKIKVQTKP